MDINRPIDGKKLALHVSRLRPDRSHGSSDEFYPQSPRSRSAHGRVSNFDQLIDRLRDIPEVRGELVAEATMKFRQGEFFTRESAEETSRAILRILV